MNCALLVLLLMYSRNLEVGSAAVVHCAFITVNCNETTTSGVGTAAAAAAAAADVSTVGQARKIL